MRLAKFRVAARRASCFSKLQRSSALACLSSRRLTVTSCSRSSVAVLSAKAKRRPLALWQSRAFGIKTHNMPDVGEGTYEVEIVEWLVTEGDAIKSLETIGLAKYGKGNIDVLAPYNSKVHKILVGAGSMAQVGEPVLELDVEGAADDAPDAKRSSEKTATTTEVESSAGKKEEQEKVESGRKLTERDVKALPGARVMAKELGLDITEIPATGRHGQVTKEDVTAFVQRGTAAPSRQPVAATRSTTVSVPQSRAKVPSLLDGDYVEKVTGMKEAMTMKMNESNLVSQFGYGDEICMDELVATRKMLKPVALKLGIKLSYVPFMVKAASLALMEFPQLNAHVNEDCTEIIHRCRHNIGVAVDSPDGLVVPNIKDVQLKSVVQLAQDMDALIERAKASRLTQEDITGGTFTLSNIGAIGGTYCSPVLFVPEVCIGAIGKMQVVPRYDDDGQLYPASVMAVGWSADHRVVEGAMIARFSNLWKQYLENPASMLLHLK